MKEIPSFFKKPDPITDIADTKEYDIVVIGAGSPGVPCALKAAELGAKVAILQKEKE
ncbi:FAD-binding protein, partial [Dialister hominis]